MAIRTVEIRNIKDAIINKYNKLENGNLSNVSMNVTTYASGEYYNSECYIFDFNMGEYKNELFIIKSGIYKLVITKNEFQYRILHSNYGGDYDWYHKNDNIILDLYRVIEEWEENPITNNDKIAPKKELLESSFVTIPLNQSATDISPITINLDLTKYVKVNNYGFCLVAHPQHTNINISGYDQQVRRLDINTIESNPQPYIELVYTTDRPVPPTITRPIGGAILNKNSTPSLRIEWTSANQSNYELHYSRDNVNWHTLTGTTRKYHNLSISSFAQGDLYIRVRYKDVNDIWSLYSPTVVCKIGQRPNKPVISLNNGIVSWGQDNTQVKYQVQLIKDSNIIEDSTEIYSKDNRYTLKTTLENNRSYNIKVRIINNLDISSLTGTKYITIDFTEPLQPQLQLITDNVRGSIKIKCNRQDGGIKIDTFEIFRKEVRGQYKKIGKNIKDEYIDYTPRSGVQYIYKIRGFTSSGGYKDSKEMSMSIKLRHSQLAIVGDYDNYVNLKYNPQRQLSDKFNNATMMFAGREKPVIEISEHMTKEIKLSFLIRSNEELNTLLYIINQRKILLYRDNRGRRKYCSITGINYSDNKRIGEYEVSFTANEVDYDEVIT